MYNFKYNLAKDKQLMERYGIGFENIISAINNGGFIITVKHPNQGKYSTQEIMYIRYIDYVYAMPYVIETDGTLFLKTFYPSRKATKLYIEGK